jgi:hypothetical protein
VESQRKRRGPARNRQSKSSAGNVPRHRVAVRLRTRFFRGRSVDDTFGDVHLNRARSVHPMRAANDSATTRSRTPVAAGR